MKKKILIINALLLLFIVIVGFCAYPIHDYGGHALSIWRNIGIMGLWYFFGLVFVNGFGIAILGMINADAGPTY